MTTRETLTQALLTASSSNELIVDTLGLLHWYRPRNASDSRPWTNSHQTRPRTRDLRPIPAPGWPDLLRLAHRLEFSPKRDRGAWVLRDTQRAWIGTAPDRNSGFRAEASFDQGGPLFGPRWRLTVWIGALQNPGTDDERTVRHHLRNADPATVLYWANRMGVLGNLGVYYRAPAPEGGLHLFKTGEPWREWDRTLDLRGPTLG